MFFGIVPMFVIATNQAITDALTKDLQNSFDDCIFLHFSPPENVGTLGFFCKDDLTDLRCNPFLQKWKSTTIVLVLEAPRSSFFSPGPWIMQESSRGPLCGPQSSVCWCGFDACCIWRTATISKLLITRSVKATGWWFSCGQDCSSCVFCAKTFQCGDIQTLEGNERVEHRPKKHSTVVVIVKLSLHYQYFSLTFCLIRATPVRLPCFCFSWTIKRYSLYFFRCRHIYVLPSRKRERGDLLESLWFNKNNEKQFCLRREKVFSNKGFSQYHRWLILFLKHFMTSEHQDPGMFLHFLFHKTC